MKEYGAIFCVTDLLRPENALDEAVLAATADEFADQLRRQGETVTDEPPSFFPLAPGELTPGMGPAPCLVLEGRPCGLAHLGVRLRAVST